MIQPSIDDVGKHFNLTQKYFRHSCYPNVLTILANGQNTMVTFRPIRKGESVSTSWVPVFDVSTLQRQSDLSQFMEKNCVCARCRGVVANAAERQQLSCDPIYQTLDTSTKVIDDCVMLLRKHGRIGWCDEIEIVIKLYQDHLHKQNLIAT